MTGFADDIFTVTRIVKVEKPKPLPIEKVYEWCAHNPEMDDTVYFDCDNLDNYNGCDEGYNLRLKLFQLQNGEIIEVENADFFEGEEFTKEFDFGSKVPAKYIKQLLRWGEIK